MKKLLRPSSLAFYLLMAIAFFMAGIYYAVLIEAAKDQMLAGGAIVLGYGILFGGIAFIAALFIAWYARPDIIRRLNWGLLVVVLVTIGIVRYLNPREDESEKLHTPPPTKPTTPAALITSTRIQDADSQLNIGFFKPNFYDNRTLYFYGGVNLQKGLIEHSPQDSVVFILDQNGNFTTSYAPPWLVPEHMVLDYGLMYFEVQSVGFDFIKVTTNKRDGRVAYLDKHAGELLFWPEFLLSVNTVEFLEGGEQPIKIKPLDHAGEVNINFVFMKPLLVGTEWMHVALLDNDFKESGKGWVRWQKEGKLLINYSLLS